MRHLILKTLRSDQHKILLEGIRKARCDAGVTQAELAERLGTVQSFVAKTEAGERRLDVVEFVRIFEALGDRAGCLRVVECLFGFEDAQDQQQSSLS